MKKQTVGQEIAEDFKKNIKKEIDFFKEENKILKQNLLTF